jgi:hypothetical protein
MLASLSAGCPAANQSLPGFYLTSSVDHESEIDDTSRMLGTRIRAQHKLLVLVTELTGGLNRPDNAILSPTSLQ